MKLSALKQSTSKENGGVWVEWNKVRFKVARFSSDRAQRWIEEEREARKESDAPRDDKTWLPRLTAHALLLDWADLETDDNTPITYSPEEAEKILLDPAFSDLLAYLVTKSQTRALYLEQEEAKQEKNSSRLSAQNSKSVRKRGPSLKHGSEGAVGAPAMANESEPSAS